MRCGSCDATPPPNARFCPSCGAPAPQAPTAAAVEERKLVTAVFCDLVGSTALAEALDPETVRVVVLRYFAAMRDEIERYGGTVEKFIGDAVMAVFGVPVMHEDDAWRAAAAALGMLDALAELNADLEPALGVRLRVRIGVHTGPAVATTDVSDRQALVSGDTVNVAARLQQHAGEGEILIGPLTRQALGSAARTEPAGPLRLKGKQEPLVAHRLLGISADMPELSRRFDLPFVGREAELDTLDRALQGVTGGAALLTISGEPGIGKTRLVRAWLDRLDRSVAHGAGRCRPYGEQGSLAPLADAVRHLVPERDAVLSAGLLRDGTPGPSLEGTCTALARQLDTLARQRPVVLVLDDCQWASDALLDLLDRLVASVRRSAVLVVCLARFDLLDRRPDWRSSLVLRGLSTVESETMAATLVEVAAHRTAEWSRILDVAGGNPFYLEQLLATLGETEGETDELPPSLQSLLGARIDALDHPERTTLNLASVLGREFTAKQVTALADTESPAAGGEPIRTALGGLTRRRLVERAGDGAPGRAAMRFSNGLVHEVTYQAITKRARALWHERTADLLTGWRAGHATVAGHLEHAYRYRAELGLLDPATDALRQRAARLLAAAGAQALNRSDLAWAGPLLRRAGELFRAGEPGWATATRQLGEILVATGHAGEGRSVLRAVLDHAAEPAEAAHARLALAVAASAAGTPGVDTAAVARETLPVFQAASDELGQARAYIRIAQDHQLRGRHARAAELLAIGLDHAVRRTAEPELALALGAIGISLWRGPTPVPEAVSRCRELLARHGAPRPVVRVTLGCPLAVLLALDDRYGEARAQLDEVRRLVDELDFAEARAVLPVFAAAVESLADRPEAALRLLDRAAGLARDLGAGGLLSTISREATRLSLDRGRPADAADRLAAVDATAATGLLRSDMADLDGLRARLTADGNAAIDLADRAVAAAVETDSPLVRAVAALDRAETLTRLGRPAEAIAAAEAAREAFAGKGHRPGLRQAARLLAHLGGN